MRLHDGTWIALSVERQTIQGYLDDGEFIEGHSEPPVKLSQRELMRYRLWLKNKKISFEHAGQCLWRGLIQVDDAEEIGFVSSIEDKQGEGQTEIEAWFEVDEGLYLCVEELSGGQYLKRERWLLQRLSAIESSMWTESAAPEILMAIADKPIQKGAFEANLDLRQWAITPAEQFVLLERPELECVRSLDIRDPAIVDPEQQAWVLQNAWHSEGLTRLCLNAQQVTELPSIIAQRQYQSLIFEGDIPATESLGVLNDQKRLQELDLGKTVSVFSMRHIEACTQLQSFRLRGRVEDWVPLILQNLHELRLPEEKWGDWIEDLQLHQMHTFQIGSAIPPREILHLEAVQYLDMHLSDDAIDSFSLHTLVLRGGCLNEALMRQIRIGTPLLKRLKLVGVEIQAGVLPQLLDLESLSCEGCQIHPDNLPVTVPSWTFLSLRESSLSRALLQQCLTPQLKALDVSGVDVALKELVVDGRLLGLESLWADGAKDPEAFFQANALVSLRQLSLRMTGGYAEEWISRQACLALEVLDLGGIEWGTLTDINQRALNALKVLRLSPRTDTAMLSDFKQRILPSAVPRLVHHLPLPKTILFPQHDGVFR